MAAIDLLVAFFLGLGFVPLAKALRANRDTTLGQPLLWALAVWVAWVGVAVIRTLGSGIGAELATYTALCLTGCAGIAVLGARRPGAGAWNFVVVGLLAVLLLPIINGLGELRLEPAQEIFLAVTLLVSILNYLPTRLGPSAILVAAGCGCELMRLLGWNVPGWGLFFLTLAPWAAWAVLASRVPQTEFDRLWLAYRDRFGFVWGQRMREQFNRAAHHAGWSVELRWTGLQGTIADATALVTMLRAVLKRFGSEEENAHG